MRVPISWLRDFVALPKDSEAIAERLAMLGFPVAAIQRRPAISGVVTARLLDVEKHPNADRLLVARVDAGREDTLTIATAATNVTTGQTIAVATIGAKLPSITIEARTMRGVASQGMMISAEELALPSEWFEDGIMQLDADVATGLDAVKFFGLDDDVLDVEITTNRPDAMSVIGLARELAASYGAELTLPSFINPGVVPDAAGLAPSVAIDSADCTRFVAQRFDDVRVAPAPAWMRVRLALAGQRPINNLVDVSNYVMLETGQPLHFYDADKLDGNQLIVRDAREGERLVTLDGIERTLGNNALVIADRRHALGLAGLMGGASSEVRTETRAIVLESANFNGPRVRRMGAALGLRTEASSRHEKSLAPALTDMGAARAAQLVCKLGATAHPPHAFGTEIASLPPISMRAGEVRRLLGFDIAPARISGHLGALGCDATVHSDTLSVTPPLWRRDLTDATDLVEEVARIEGYDRIPAEVPSVPSHEISSAAFDLENKIAHALAALGYREIITHSLRPRGDAGAVEVRNPISEEYRFLRDSLLPGLIEYFAGNLVAPRVFEIGDVFRREDAAISERTQLAFGFIDSPAGEPPWRDSSFLRLKADCEALLRAIAGPRHFVVAPQVRNGFHPGKTGIATLDGIEVGIIGAVDPRLIKAQDLGANLYLSLIDVAALPPYKVPKYRPPSRFPSTYRDLALVVDAELPARALEEAIAQTLGSLCTAVCVFDEYRGPQVDEGRKSLAVRVVLARFDATITDEEADAAVARVLDAVGETFGATIRR
jgi:phenylalanyl-tRNA synthetase beta chain